MGVYLNYFWQPDGGGMNKAERMGGSCHPYLPDMLADYELLLSPSCASAVVDAQAALAKLELASSRVDTELLARMMLRVEHRLDSADAQGPLSRYWLEEPKPGLAGTYEKRSKVFLAAYRSFTVPIYC